MRSPDASKKDAPAHMPTFPYARRGMCEGRTICGSSLRVISGQWLPLYGIVCVPPAPAKQTPPPICRPSPTQGEGCVKGGPSAGPPFAFDQGSDFQVCAGVALPVPRPTKKTPCPNNKSFPVGGKDSVKENRQGCLSRSIRAGAIKSAKRDALPVP